MKQSCAALAAACSIFDPLQFHMSVVNTDPDSLLMQVPVPEQQHRVMIEAVENHMPEVIVIDEIGSEAEALAAATIAQRGVQLVATAHGERLENILNNPTLQSLLGGVERSVSAPLVVILTHVCVSQIYSVAYNLNVCDFKMM